MKRIMFRSTLAVLASVGLLTASADSDQQGDDNHSSDQRPNGRGDGNRFAKPGGGGASGNGINYHGGPLILGVTDVYFIWYGNWSGSDPNAAAILTNLANSLGGSPYFNINTTYYDGAGTHVSNSVAFKAQVNVIGYPYGTSLSDSQVAQVVVDALNGKNVTAQLPVDSNGVYFVLTSQDVTASSGFCTQYCGWHTYGTLSNGTPIKYAFVGNPARCPSACTNGTLPPNGDVGADGMASIVSHELEEAVTDPQLNAWYDRRGQENADKCAWTFGNTYTTSNGGLANMNLGGRNYLIQQNWVNANGGFCALSH